MSASILSSLPVRMMQSRLRPAATRVFLTATDLALAVLQCSVVMTWSLSPFICAGLLFVILLSPSLLPLLALYLVWVAIDWHTPFTGGSNRLELVRRWQGWHHWKNYFGVQLVKAADLAPDRNYIFVYHPHGLYCFGAFCNFVTQVTGFHHLYPDIHLRLTTLRFNFFCPFWREIVLIYRFISVDFKSCKQWLMSPLQTGAAGAEIAADKEVSHDRRDSGIDVDVQPAQEAQSTPPPNSSCEVFEVYNESGDAKDEDDPLPLSPISDYDDNNNNNSPSATSSAIELPLRRRTAFRQRTPSPVLPLTPSSEDGSSSSSTLHDTPHPASRKGEGKALLICVGGADESLLARPGKIELVLHKRKGFIRLALDCGASLVPVITFGEVDIYKQVPNPPGSLVRRFQNSFKQMFGWTIPFSYGRIGMFLPFRRPLVTVVGEPLHVPWIPNPSGEDVAHWHKLYVDKLTSLYDQYKDVYDPDREADMEIVG
ncbi:diacylglycerol O-acyltransferase 1 [Sorochytrium milnesiophthora]